MTDTNKMREEFEAAFAQETVRRAVEDGLLELNESAELLACTIFVMAKDRDGDTYGEVHFASAWWAWQASNEALLKKQVREQEEFLDHLADFEREDTFHG